MKTNKFILTTLIAIAIISTLSNCHLFHSNNNNYAYDTTSIQADSAYAASEDEYYGPDMLQIPTDRVWQLMHTDLNLTFNWLERTIQGTAILKLKPYFYAQDSLVLDAKAMDILSIEINQPKSEGPPPEKLRFSYSDSEHLVIYFKTIQMPQNPIEIKINYIANPERELSTAESNAGQAILAEKGVYFINHNLENPAIPRQLWSQGETRGSRCWFPTIDQPNQKHTQKITLTYPDTMISISNGERISHKKLEKTNEFQDVWEQNLPHSVYLTMIALGNWAETLDNYNGKMVRYYVEPKFKNDAKTIFGHTPEMIKFFSNYTGVEYPWKKFDQVVCREFVSGAMENTTAVVHSEDLQDKDNEMEDYISHELFHHWFGDYVTADNWGEITMNESFARYGEMLWNESYYGPEKAQEWLFENNSAWLKSKKSERTSLVNYFYEKPDDQFDEIRYNKGAAILNMLRDYIGEEAFKLSIKDYLSKNALGNTTYTDWKKSIEKITGKNMDDFFNSWYTGLGKTSINWYLTKSENGKYNLTIFQEIGNQKCFKLDIDYASYNGLHRHKKSIWFGSNNSEISFELETDTLPDYILLNPNNTFPGTVEYRISDPYINREERTSRNFVSTAAMNQLLINNFYSSKYEESKIANLMSIYNNWVDSEEMDSSFVHKIKPSILETNNPNLLLAGIEFITSKLEIPFIQLIPQLKARLLSDKTSLKMKRALSMLLIGYLDEKESLSLFKSTDHTLLTYVSFGFHSLSVVNGTGNKLSTETIDYFKNQIQTSSNPKRIFIFGDLLTNYNIMNNESPMSTISLLKSSKIDIENMLKIYKSLFEELGNSGKTNETFISLMDNAFEKKDMNELKMLKIASKEYYSGIKNENESITESARLLKSKLTKLHNFKFN